ncbi:MAG TPA: substrate-binding domain-containing protein [Pseudonocardiaceae bacterium]|jgi:molybdate/tungstate transport system substrate-binding protein|nr:substrate-binding domain-containing protein [Pseudonocardiaceae bacterium]
MRKPPVVLAVSAVLLIGGLAGCASTASASSASSPGAARVLYAGSLANLMEHDLGPAFQQATGGTFEGVGAGSTQLVTEIKGRTTLADVFISASTDADSGLIGAGNGDWESWYATFATAPLVIGYNPNSTFAADLRGKPWQQVITEPGFRMGSTDPKLDPKGKLAAQALTEARISSGAVSVFPEEQLVGRLQSGQLDAGFFYSNEAAEQNIPTIGLGSIGLGSVKLQATYTVTVLNRAPDQTAAISFVRYLLGAAGQALLRKHGLTLRPVTVTGDSGAVPAELRGALRVG